MHLSLHHLPVWTIRYGPGLCSPPQYNTLKTHQFLLETVCIVAAFHRTHSPTCNGTHPVTLDHQNISSSNIKLWAIIRAGNLIGGITCEDDKGVLIIVSNSKCWDMSSYCLERKQVPEKFQGPAGNQTQDLLNASQALLPLIHWCLWQRSGRYTIHRPQPNPADSVSQLGPGIFSETYISLST